MRIAGDLADAGQGDPDRLHSAVTRTGARRLRRPGEAVAQRQREGRRRNLEDVALPRLDAVGEGQGRGAEEVDVDVAGAPEQGIFEMVVLEVGEAVRHVRLAAQEGLLPQDLPVAQDPAGAAQILRQIADQQFRSQRGRTQLGMGEPEVIAALGDMVGEFVGEREAQAARPAVGVDQIDAGDLGLLAAVERESGRLEVAAGRDEARAVALVEPFGLDPRPLPFGLAAFDAHQEHPRRIRSRPRPPPCASGRGLRPSPDG